MCDQITSHKTNQAFGPAQLVLLDEKHEWGKTLLAKTSSGGGGHSNEE